VNSWKKILGRIGKTLVMLGLILLLVTVWPQIPVRTTEGYQTLTPEQARIGFNQQGFLQNQELKISVTVHDEFLKFYLLDMSVKDKFIREANTKFNATILQQFLTEHPDQVLWNKELEEGQYEWSYTTPEIVDATIVFYNPTSEYSAFGYKVLVYTSLAPGDTIQKLAFCTTLIGLVLALPWFLTSWKQRKNKQLSRLSA
jgi:hypothetical protein